MRPQERLHVAQRIEIPRTDKGKYKILSSLLRGGGRARIHSTPALPRPRSTPSRASPLSARRVPVPAGFISVRGRASLPRHVGAPHGKRQSGSPISYTITHYTWVRFKNLFRPHEHTKNSKTQTRKKRPARGRRAFWGSALRAAGCRLQRV